MPRASEEDDYSSGDDAEEEDASPIRSGRAMLLNMDDEYQVGGDVGSSAIPADTGKRTRRSVTRALVATETEMAEFDDEDNPQKMLKGTNNRQLKQKRCPGCGEWQPPALKVCRECDYAFPLGKWKKEKEYVGQPAAGKITFEPEYAEDGTVKLEKILGRRLIQPIEEAEATKSVKAYMPTTSTVLLSFAHRNPGDRRGRTRYDYEYLVKYKGMSYKQLQWKSANDLEGMGTTARQHLNRCVKKYEAAATEKGEADIEEEFFDPTFCEAEKILDHKEFDVEVELTSEEMAKLYEEEERQDNAAFANNLKKSTDAARAVVPSTNSSNSQGGIAAPVVLSAPAPYTFEGQFAAVDVDGGEGESKGVARPKEDMIWRPMTRCMKVLEKLNENVNADIFRHPVDVKMFPDYLDVIEKPMDLTTIKNKLEEWKYKRNDTQEFAKDVRQIWQNCKIYNKHGSSIWYTADYMSKHFERLYAAWVVHFANKALPYDHPLATPWDLSCRLCLQDDNATDIILCDCCDAEYHTYCLSPPLEAVPVDLWQCPRCRERLDAGERLHSNAMEEIARARAEATDRRVKMTRVTKYLVKWRNLSYRECTWETKESVNDDSVIEAYHRLNDMPPIEPPMTEAELARELNPALFLQAPAMKGSDKINEIDARIYAQIRSFHFLRNNVVPPTALLRECGYATTNFVEEAELAAKAVEGEIESEEAAAQEKATREEIRHILFDMKASIAKGVPYSPDYGPLVPVEYEITIPKINNSLYINIAEEAGLVRVESIRDMGPPKNEKAPIAKIGKVRKTHCITAVNGVPTTGRSFDETIKHLKAVPPFVTLRITPDPPKRLELMKEWPFRDEFPPPQEARQPSWHPPSMAAESIEPISDSDDGDDDESPEIVVASRVGLGSMGQKRRLMLAVTESSNPPNAEDWESDVFRLAEAERLRQAQEVMARLVPTPRGRLTKAIDQVNPGTGQVIRVWESLTAASRYLGISMSSISLCVNGQLEEAGGFRWRFARDLSMLSRQPALPPPGTLVAGVRSVPAGGPPPVTAVPSNTEATNGEGSTVKVEETNGSVPDSGVVKEEIGETDALMEGASTPSKGERYDAQGFAQGLGPALLDDDQTPLKMGAAGEDLGDEGAAWKSLLPHESLDYKGNKLRDYQVDGLRWMLTCWYRKRSCILADEMGLGKTVQVTTALDHIFKVERISGPFLVVVPLSTIEHWRREIEGWTDMHLCVYHDIGGGKDMRDVIREYEWYYKDRTKRILKFHVLVTTYDDLIRDAEELSEVAWRSVVVDEAHRLRNLNSKLLESLRIIMMKGHLQYGFQHRILMTGTPLQNNMEELWSLMNFIEPDRFGDRVKFLEKYGAMETENQVRSLQRRIAPFMLRRVKEDVASDIPPKEETLVDVELTMIQKQYYRAIFEKSHSLLFKVGGNSGGNLPSLMNIQMELRKCCNHAFLVRGVEDHEVDNMVKALIQTDGTADDKKLARERLEKGLVQSSGKMVLLDKLLPKLRREGHKVLIFSQFITMLDMIAEFCSMKGFAHERLDGRVTGNERQKAIDRFNTNADSFLFLLSTRAGGVGINLVAADTCIIYDSDWNPQNDIQAMARCHRIGQTREVMVYRLITRSSFESEMFARASRKLGLEQAVLGNPRQNEKMSTKEMELLLREGAYALLEDDSAAIEEFTAMDIDKILEKKSRIIRTEVASKDNRTADWLSKKDDDGDAETGGWKRKRNTFRKSKFMSEEDASLDVDDPDFWSKVMPDLVTPQSLIRRLEENGPAESRPAAKAFMRDVEKMVTGLKAAQSRGRLDQEDHKVGMKVLISITIKTDVFTDDQRLYAQTQQRQLEGSRLRQSVRADVDSDEDGEGTAWTGAGRRAPLPAPKREGRDNNMELCAICEEGGELLLCDGPCNRSFHPPCLALDELPPQFEEWLCPDCTAQVHTCLICMKSGPVGGEGKTGVHKCSLNVCGRYYHLACIKADDRARWMTDKKGQESFKCPQHYCKVCCAEGKYSESSGGGHTNRASMAKCMRCPSSYHETCLRTTSHLRKGKLVVCEDHELDSKEKAMQVEQIRKREEKAANALLAEERLRRRGPLPDQQFPVARTFSAAAFPEECTLCRGEDGAESSIEGPLIRPPFIEVLSQEKSAPIWIHRNCAIFSPECYVKLAEGQHSSGNAPLTTNELEGAEFFNVVKAKKRGRGLRCAGCTKIGATIGCYVPACRNSYHFACALETGWRFGTVPDRHGKEFRCSNHRNEGCNQRTDPYSGDTIYTIAATSDSEVEESDVGAGNSFCPCGKADTGEEVYIQCDGCEGWWHAECAGVDADDAADLDAWSCNACSGGKKGTTKKKKGAGSGKGKRKRREEQHDDVDEDGPAASFYKLSAPAAALAYPHALSGLRAGDPEGWFEHPVTNDVAPNYSNVVARPMCWSMLEEAVRAGEYAPRGDGGGVKGFAKDAGLVYTNCMVYNAMGSDLWSLARESLEKLPYVLAQAAAAVTRKGKKGTSTQHGDSRKVIGVVHEDEDDEGDIEKAISLLESLPDEKHLKAAMLGVLDRLKEADLDDIFEEVVSPEDAPGYYDEIPNPTSFSKIDDKIRRRRHTPATFINELNLVFLNCIQYNGGGSEISEFANSQLESVPLIIAEIVDQIRSGQVPQQQGGKKVGGKYIPVVRPIKSDEAIKEELWGLAAQLATLTPSEAGTVMKDAVARARKSDKGGYFDDPVDETNAPGYSNVIKRPICLSAIHSQIKLGMYNPGAKTGGPKRFVEDLNLVFANCIQYNAEGSALTEAAKKLQQKASHFVSAALAKLQQKKLEKQQAMGEGTSGRKRSAAAREPDAASGREELWQSIENGRKKAIMAAVLTALRAEDVDGMFESPVDDEDAPGYSDIVTSPMCLSTVEQGLRKGRYLSFPFQDFLDDVCLIYTNCKLYNAEGSGLYEAAAQVLRNLPGMIDNAFAGVAPQQQPAKKQRRESGEKVTKKRRKLGDIETDDEYSHDAVGGKTTKKKRK